MRPGNPYRARLLVPLGLAAFIGSRPATGPLADGAFAGPAAHRAFTGPPTYRSLERGRPAAPRRVYVPSHEAGIISAIDLERNEVLWTLKVSEGAEGRPARAAMGLAATHDGRLVFTGDVPANEVVVVDADARRIVKRIPVPHMVHAIDISPDDRQVWVAGRLEAHPWLSATSVVDVRTLEVVAAPSPALGNAAHFAFTPDGRQVWAASITTRLVWVIDAVTREVIDAIPLVADGLGGTTPEGRLGLIGFNGITVSPDGSRASAVGPDPGALFAIDVASRRVVGRVPIGDRVHDVAVTRDGREIWTANNVGTVTIIDAATLEVDGELDMRRYADELTFAHVAFSLDGERAYLSWEEAVVVVDVDTREVVATIPVAEEPHEISLEDYYVRP